MWCVFVLICQMVTVVPRALLSVLELQSLGAGERDDRDVIAAMEASKRKNNNSKEEEDKQDPEVLEAIAESK